MVVHPGYNNYTGTLVNALLYHVGFRSTGVADEPHLPELPGNQGRPGLVHRIDKDTSGLLLVARQEVSMTFLARSEEHPSELQSLMRFSYAASCLKQQILNIQS